MSASVEPEVVAKPKPSGKPSTPKNTMRAQSRKALKAEIAELRARLELTESVASFEDWGASAPQDIRDRMAARALVSEYLNGPNALKRLGFKITDEKGRLDRPYYLLLVKKVFETPGVRAILAHDLKDIEQVRKEVLARQTEIALHGEEGNAVRAATVIAKIAGWNKEEEGKTVQVNLYQLINGNTSSAPKLAVSVNAAANGSTFLDHDPGEAVVIRGER